MNKPGWPIAWTFGEPLLVLARMTVPASTTMPRLKLSVVPLKMRVSLPIFVRANTFGGDGFETLPLSVIWPLPPIMLKLSSPVRFPA